MAVRAVFPVVAKDEGLGALDVPARYVIAANGIFLEQRTPWFAAGTRVDRVAGLQVEGLAAHEEWLELTLPALDGVLVAQALGFFRTVYERWGGEAILLLFRERPAPGNAGRWALDAPSQLMSGRWRADGFHAGLRLVYGTCDKPGREWMRAGSMHSHGSGAAYHSETDVQDEVGGAGLHITAGRIDSAQPEFAASFVVGETRFALRTEDIVAPPTPAVAAPAPPTHWMARVAPMGGGQQGRSAEVPPCA